MRKATQQGLQTRREALWGACSEERAHEQPEVARGSLQQDSLQHVLLASDVDTSQAAGLVAVRVAALGHFSAALAELLSAVALDPASVRVDRVAFPGLVSPASTATRRLADVRPKAHLARIGHHVVAVVALVQHDLLDAVLVGQRFLDEVARLVQRLQHRLRVAAIGGLHRHGHDRRRVEIRCVLDFVREVRAPVLHLRDACVRVARVHPVVVATLLLALLVELRSVLAARRRDAAGLGQVVEEGVVRAPIVLAHDRTQGGIGLERGRVDRDRLALQQPATAQDRQDPGEDLPVRLEVDQSSRPRERAVVGRRLCEVDAQEAAQRQAVRAPPGDLALAADALEVPDHQQPEVHAGRRARAAHRLGVVTPAALLDEAVEALLFQERVHPLVEGVSRRARQFARRHKERRLPLRLSVAHRHALLSGHSVAEFSAARRTASIASSGLSPRAARLGFSRDCRAGFPRLRGKVA